MLEGFCFFVVKNLANQLLCFYHCLYRGQICLILLKNGVEKESHRRVGVRSCNRAIPVATKDHRARRYRRSKKLFIFRVDRGSCTVIAKNKPVPDKVASSTIGKYPRWWWRPCRSQGNSMRDGAFWVCYRHCGRKPVGCQMQIHVKTRVYDLARQSA